MLIYILFIISPFVAVIAYTFVIYQERIVFRSQIWNLAIILAIYLGLLNSTKELSGDFLNYSEYFYDVPRYNILSYVMGFGKEPLYYAYTWIAYYIFFGNWKLFVVSITAINYLLLSSCIINISKHLNISS